MLGIAGILRQQLTGKLRTFTAMDKSLTLRAHRDRTLPMEGMPTGLDTAAAAALFLIGAIAAMQTAP